MMKDGIVREERGFGREKETRTIYRNPKLMTSPQFRYEWVGPYSNEAGQKARNLQRALQHWGYEILYYEKHTGRYCQNRIFCFIVDKKLERMHMGAVERLGVRLFGF